MSCEPEGERLVSGKRVLIVSGSPRRNGNCAVLVEEVAAGARATGADVEVFDLANMDIRPCDACDSCQETGGGICVIRDDMQELYSRLRQADAIAIASPIYWFTMSAQTKVFIDRCYALQGTGGNVLAGKRIGILLVYGDADPFSSGAINAIRTFQDMFHYIQAPIAGIVYGSANAAGEIRSQPGMLEKAHQLGQQLGA
jgi:multimeric flavodoxin WrbA